MKVMYLAYSLLVGFGGVAAMAENTVVYDSHGRRTGTAETTTSETNWGNGRTTDTTTTVVHRDADTSADTKKRK